MPISKALAKSYFMVNQTYFLENRASALRYISDVLLHHSNILGNCVPQKLLQNLITLSQSWKSSYGQLEVFVTLCCQVNQASALACERLSPGSTGPSRCGDRRLPAGCRRLSSTLPGGGLELCHAEVCEERSSECVCGVFSWVDVCVLSLWNSRVQCSILQFWEAERQTSLTGPCLSWQISQHTLLCPFLLCTTGWRRGTFNKMGFGAKNEYLCVLVTTKHFL